MDLTGRVPVPEPAPADSKVVLYRAVAAWNLATSSLGTRPRSLTSMPCDLAHSRTAVGSGPLVLDALRRLWPGRRVTEPGARRAALRYGASAFRSASECLALRSIS